MAARSSSVKLSVVLSYEPDYGPYRLEITSPAGRTRFTGELGKILNEAFAEQGRQLQFMYNHASLRPLTNLTDDQIRKIRLSADSVAVIAREQSLSQTTVSRIRSRKAYAHVI